MTDPILTSGGRTITVTKTAVMLTEYAPVTVINTAVNSRVWLAGSSAVSPGSGVPLDAGTSYDWATTGPLWAILDPAATDTSVSLVITGSGGNWTPSPVAIGAAVAAELATQGVPSKLLIDLVGSWNISTTTFTDIPVDLSGYESIMLNMGTPGFVTYVWKDKAGNIISDNLYAYVGTQFQMMDFIPVIGNTLSIALDQDPAGAEGLTIFGYNRSFAPAVPPWGAVWTGTLTPTSGGSVALNLSSGTAPSEGLATCYLNVYPLPSGTNRIQLQLTPSSGFAIPNLIIQDYTMPVAGTGIFLPFQAAFPRKGNYVPVLRSFSTIAANVGISLHTVQANPS